jgi:rhodanese-related sulfurtransferase
MTATQTAASTSTAITLVSANDLAHHTAAGHVDETWNALVDAYFTGEMIPGSIRVPVNEVGREIERRAIPRDRTIAVYCSGPTCPNSRQAAEKLAAFGFTKVLLFEGGLEEWKASGRETVQLQSAE